MVLNIQLREDQEQAVRDLAKQRGVTADELARQAVVDLIDKSDDPEFDGIIGRVLSRNAELYRRLA